jgi:hypothetical protein
VEGLSEHGSGPSGSGRYEEILNTLIKEGLSSGDAHIGCSELRLIAQHFTVGTSCERAAPLVEKNAAAWHHILRSVISLHNEHRV